jgi:hypothetical protein
MHAPVERTPQPSETIAPPPAAAFVAPAPPSSFHAVIQHDTADDEAHRPVRRRPRQGSGQVSEAPTALQLVETQAATPPPQEPDDALPRRTRPRRRRGGSQPNEPLMLVETQHDANRSDPPSVP